MHRSRIFVGPIISLILLLMTIASAQEAVPESARKFLQRPEEPMPASVAIRRLEAQAQRFAGTGWIRVRVTVVPGASMTWTVLEEGGSGYIRDKVLLPMLEGEADTVKKNLATQSGVAELNYRFSRPAATDPVTVPPGLERFRIIPRRADMMLVDGTAWVAAADGDLIQVDGRLAKSPSFWMKTVDVVRRYARIEGVRVPVLTESTADVRFAGRTVLRMTYDYESINGQPASDAGARR